MVSNIRRQLMFGHHILKELNLSGRQRAALAILHLNQE